MNYRTMFQKTYLAFLMVFMFTVVSLVGLQVTVQGSGEEVDGSITSFGYNNPTEISGLSIFESGLTTNVSELSRIDDFELNFNVYDIDGFRHLDVYIVLYNTATRNDDSGVTSTFINSGVKDNALVIRWLAPERALYLSGLTVDAGETFAFPIDSGIDNFLVKSGTSGLDTFYSSDIADFVRPTDFNNQSDVTWVVYSGSSEITDSGLVSVYDASGVETSSGNRVLRRNVTIPIKLSKVAPSPGVWNYAVYVYDRLQQEISQPKTDVVEPHYLRANDDYTNQWYGEIDVQEGAFIEFPTVEAGSGFSQSSGVVSVLFVSNGTYSQLVNADTTWKPNATVPGRPIFAYLINSSGFTGSDGTEGTLGTEGNRFSLQANRVSINGVNDSDNFVDLVLNSGAGLVPPRNDGSYAQAREDSAVSSKIVQIETASGTTEAGINSTFNFQIKLSRVFQTVHSIDEAEQTTIYTGNIQLGISNSTESGVFFDPNDPNN